VDGRTLRVLDDPAPLGQPGQLVVAQLLEQEQRAQLLGRQPLVLARREPLGRVRRQLIGLGHERGS
jgi:hypothetical protein